MIEEIKCSITKKFSIIEKRLESLEKLTKSSESVSIYINKGFKCP